MDYYIKKAGGYASNAYKRHAYVILANGMVEARKGPGRNYINAGSEIVVPEKPEEEKKDWMGLTQGFLAILASLVTIIVLSRTF